jgi:predicted dehydrogenase
VSVFGENGYIIIESPVYRPPHEMTKITLTTNDESNEICIEATDQYSLQADAFAHAILNDLPVPTPLDDAIGNMAVIDAVRESASTGKRVILS